jgi:hypothetical protein
MKKNFDSTKTRLALAAASLVILGVHGAVFYQQFFHKWESYQTAYFDQARSLAKTDAERAAVAGRKPRVEQIIVTQFGENRVDRCTTCHIGADDPRFKDYAAPLKSHPFSAELGDKQLPDGKWERRHKFSDFGCTVCHDGQGRGLEEFYAHGEDEFWTEPMLGYVTQENWRGEFKEKLRGKDYMQANCAPCHTEETFKSERATGATRAAAFRGEKLLRLPPRGRRFQRHTRPGFVGSGPEIQG